jgi:hypothetical protein
MTTTWFYTRIVVFPIVIYNVGFAVENVFHGRPFQTINYLSIHLCILFILHIYWFGLLLRAISKFISGGKLQEASDNDRAGIKEQAVKTD